MTAEIVETTPPSTPSLNRVEELEASTLCASCQEKQQDRRNDPAACARHDASLEHTMPYVARGDTKKNGRIRDLRILPSSEPYSTRRFDTGPYDITQSVT
ncbi:MAG: hypothetical protein G01um101438_1002 [Parcubacteria group bacterium Gr01-1014_38]|nr:MAG: hypothetical protein G01um101438_1002 [Parcubacteria group bacterium Gr01-1014_38]